MNNAAALPKSKGFKLHNFLLVIVLGIATGIFLGSWYSYSLVTGALDYSGYTEEAFVDKFEDVISKVLGISNPTTEQCENWLELAKQKGITPLDLLPSQNFILAEYNASKASSYTAIGTGKVDTIVEQNVYSARLFDGNAYSFISISTSSLVNVAEVAYMQLNASTVKTVKGNDITKDSATWNGKPALYTADDYKEMAGNTPDKIQPYIISSKTVLGDIKSNVSEENYNNISCYKLSFQLNPIASVINYVKQMAYTSGLGYPIFDDITQTVYIDENWNFVRIEIKENYRVDFKGFKPKCTGTLNTDFVFNEPVTLPINE